MSYDVDPILPGAGNLNGNVTVTAGTASCTGNVTVTGGGSCALALPDPGTFDVTATYGNDPNFAASTSPTATHVVRSPTSLTITPGHTGPVHGGKHRDGALDLERLRHRADHRQREPYRERQCGELLRRCRHRVAAVRSDLYRPRQSDHHGGLRGRRELR